MRFQHHPDIWRAYPQLVPFVASTAIDPGERDTTAVVHRYTAIARERLDGRTESELPEIQAWRRVFSSMGLKPTQYRSASEALLRRFRKDGSLPRVHPLVDVCNAISIAFAVPIAVFDLDHVSGSLDVRHADGDEIYLTFSGEDEHPEPGEVIFADDARQVHARRWCNRQSGASAMQAETRRVLIVSEAMHETARTDMPRLGEAIVAALQELWDAPSRGAILTPDAPVFDAG